MIELVDGRATARVDETCGARVADLVVAGVGVLVTGDASSDDPLDWGIYPMVPFAGRLRRGELPWRGDVHRLPLRRPPHAIHGTVLDVAWEVEQHTASSCSLTTPLVAPWPFAGRVVHDVMLHDGGLDLRLTVHAEVDMPVQIGWHPWFRKPAHTHFPFTTVHPRDESGIADPMARPITGVRWGDVDDCFGDLDGLLTIDVEGLELTLRSSCTHWVVYDRPAHATCVEPQSGPPDILAVDPTVVPAGHSRHETFTVSWSG